MKLNNLEMLSDTLSILQQGSYMKDGRKINLKLSASQMEDICVYLPEDIIKLEADQSLPEIPLIETIEFCCENVDSFTLARKDAALMDLLYPDGHLPVLVLNLANPVNPGGGVRRGARAQEEDLCRKSSLLFSLESETARAYYSYNRSLSTFMGSDAIMITPQVEIIKDEQGNLLDDSVIVSVMTCAAPMLTFGREGMSERQYQHMVYKRIMRMLEVAAHLGYRTLVLGAFGCGAFDNDAKVVSDLFYKAMIGFNYGGRKLSDCFRRIDFAVMDHSRSQYNYNHFAGYFNDTQVLPGTLPR